MSYAMNIPMDWNAFKSMPLDLQQSYLDGLHARFGVGAANVGVDLFGLSKSGLGYYIKSKGLKPIGDKSTRLHGEMRELWKNWLHPVEPVKSETIEEPETEDTQTIEEPVAEDPMPYNLPVLSVTNALKPENYQYDLNDLLRTDPAPPVTPKSTITMEPPVRDFSVSDLAATFTGKFDPEKFIKWVSMLPMPEGDVKIRVEVTAR